MKKDNNKINKFIILSIIALIFTISLVIFILNYTKDSSSFSIIEKNWINSHTSNIIDIGVYNDVPVYGQNGDGVIFSFLEEFTSKYEISFNKVSYLAKSGKTNQDVAFKILDFDTELTENDIEIYRDYYVIVGLEMNIINDISDLEGSSIGVIKEDLANIKYYLNDNEEIELTECADFDEMLNYLKGKKLDYIAIPRNLYLDEILKNKLNITYHMNELYKKYILTVDKDKTFRSIMNKFNMIYGESRQEEHYKKYFLNTFFKYKELSEAERMNYNAASYVFGYINYMPFENTVNKEFVGILSNYLSGFEDLANVDFTLVEYNNFGELKQALSRGEVDLVFANFDLTGINVDILNTSSPFKEEYVILSQKPMIVNSIRSLKGNDIYTITGTYLYDYIALNSINLNSFDNTDKLLRGINNDSIIALDKDTYEYYKDNKFKNYKVVYQGTLNEDYTFAVRDVNKNATFYELFNYYVSSINYKNYKYAYNTDYIVNSKNEFNTMLKYVGIVVGGTILIISILLIIFRIRDNKRNLNKEDKLKFIDVMTSLKNRNYLNYNIKTWEENVIYPQSIIIIDLNNIKYINDNYGHEEGDEVIKKAASILIANQQENTDIMRTDGNEFLIYMVGYDEKKVIEYTRHLSKELKELPHEFGATLGYSMILDDVKTIDDAINEATLSMRQAKERL
jgi:diguanylate cyclase (GGDEF)-like protein